MTREQLEDQLDLLQQLSENERDYGDWLKLQAEIIRIQDELYADDLARSKSARWAAAAR